MKFHLEDEIRIVDCGANTSNELLYIDGATPGETGEVKVEDDKKEAEKTPETEN